MDENSKPKILIFVDQLSYGGVGRVCSILINGLVNRGYNVAVAVMTKRFPIEYQISDQVDLYELYDSGPIKNNVFGKIKNCYYRYINIRTILTESSPSLVIAFTHLIFFYVKVFSIGLHIPIIASDHTSMGRDLGFFTNYLRHNFYSKAEKVTILTHKDAELLGRKLPNKVIIYNPVTYSTPKNTLIKEKIVLCVGRIDSWKVKGFDMMLNMWSSLSYQFPDWKLIVVGPGDKHSYDYLETMTRDLGIYDRVSFLGSRKDMISIYQKASVFALPSRVEGFPMVLLEAMSQGDACVSFSMQGAINEIITDGEDGIIVQDGDVNLFIKSLEALMKSCDDRNRLSKAAMDKVKNFSITSFLDRWEQVIGNVLKLDDNDENCLCPRNI